MNSAEHGRCSIHNCHRTFLVPLKLAPSFRNPNLFRVQSYARFYERRNHDNVSGVSWIYRQSTEITERRRYLEHVTTLSEKAKTGKIKTVDKTIERTKVASGWSVNAAEWDAIAGAKEGRRDSRITRSVVVWQRSDTDHKWCCQSKKEAMLRWSCAERFRWSKCKPRLRSTPASYKTANNVSWTHQEGKPTASCSQDLSKYRHNTARISRRCCQVDQPSGDSEFWTMGSSPGHAGNPAHHKPHFGPGP